MAFDISSAVNAAASQGVDMTKAQSGGGDYQPPAKGVARARFIGYIEGGKQKHEWEGKVSYKDKVRLIFELSGPKHPPHENGDGEKFPIRITIEENLSLNEKAHFYKIFRAMNYDGDATHIAQLLGKEFLVTVAHKESKKGRVFATLKNDAGQYTIRTPYHEDPETGETRKISANPQISETRLFLWDFASKEMWDSLYIEGEYPEKKDDKTGEVIFPARSKNVFQEWILGANNFEGSPIDEILQGEIELPEETQEPEQADEEQEPEAEEKAPAKGKGKGKPSPADEDPLAGVS